MANTQNEAITFSSVAAGTNLHFVCDTVMDLDDNSNATNIAQIGTPYNFSWSGTGASGGKNYNVNVSGQWNGYYFGTPPANTVDLWTAEGTVNVSSSDTSPPMNKTFSFSNSGGSATPAYMTGNASPANMFTKYSNYYDTTNASSDLWKALANPSVEYDLASQLNMYSSAYGTSQVIQINTTATSVKAVVIDYQMTPHSTAAYMIAGTTSYLPLNKGSEHTPLTNQNPTLFTNNADIHVYAATSYYNSYAPAGFTAMTVDGNRHKLLLIINESIQYLWIYGNFSSGTNKIYSLRIYV